MKSVGALTRFARPLKETRFATTPTDWPENGGVPERTSGTSLSSGRPIRGARRLAYTKTTSQSIGKNPDYVTNNTELSG